MPIRARAHTSRRRTPARDSGVREPRRGPLPGVSNRPADAFRRRRSRPAGPGERPLVGHGGGGGEGGGGEEEEPACGEAAFFAGAVKVKERRFDGPGVQRRHSVFACAVLEAGICERRTRLAGPLFRPAGCAVARAGVRRPCRGRRPSRPRHGGRTALPGPAGGGVRPAGGAGVRSGALYPLRGRMGRLCVQANLSTWHGVSRGRASAPGDDAAVAVESVAITVDEDRIQRRGVVPGAVVAWLVLETHAPAGQRPEPVRPRPAGSGVPRARSTRCGAWPTPARHGVVRSVHEAPPPLEQVRPRVRRLDLVADDVGERRLDDLARMVRLPGRPVPERRPEVMDHGRDVAVLEDPGARPGAGCAAGGGDVNGRDCRPHRFRSGAPSRNPAVGRRSRERGGRPGRPRPGRAARPTIAIRAAGRTGCHPPGPERSGGRAQPVDTPAVPQLPGSQRTMELLDLAPVVRRPGGAVSMVSPRNRALVVVGALPHSPTSAERTSPA